MSETDERQALLDVLCEIRREWAISWYSDPSPWDFRSWVQARTAEFLDFELENPPESVEMAIEHVSVDGTPLEEFLAQADELAWRDGGVIIWVRQGNNVLLDTEEGVQRVSNQPRLQLIERAYLLEYETEIHAGANRLVSASFIDGDNLRVFTPERMRLLSLDGKQRVLEEGHCPGLVPLVWYDLNHGSFGDADLPLLRVMRLGNAYAKAWREFQAEPDDDPGGARLMQWQQAVESVDLSGLLNRFVAVKQRHWLSIQQIWCMHTGERPTGVMHLIDRELAGLAEALEEED